MLHKVSAPYAMLLKNHSYPEGSTTRNDGNVPTRRYGVQLLAIRFTS